MFKPTKPVIDFPQLEKKILSYWQKKGIVKKYLLKNSTSAKRFSFLDGPITANNPMGVHHAWGRTYKDLWQRFNTMKGKKQRYQNGFDCQGLWVEVEVEKELGFKTKKDIEKYGVANFVQKCKERVLKYAAIQTEQSKRLGYFMDWNHSYFTMSDENNYMIWHFLKQCFNKGWIYKGKDSVPWCPRCETAISQHEMLTEDYKEVTHESIYMKFPLIGRKESLLVWTTTPWTIPANIAVAVDKDLTYSLVEDDKGNLLWLAREAVERVFKGKKKKIVKSVSGKVLVGLKYETVFDDLPAVQETSRRNPQKFHIVIETDKQIMPIVTNEGTGLVHTAVSAGTEDFRLGQKLGLPLIPVIADDASYLAGLGDFAGKNAKNEPRIILDYILKKGEKWFFAIEKYKHRYPVCWRCKTELVWKVTSEWYIAMDKPANSKLKETFREAMMRVAKQINWLPSFGLERELDWLKNMGDWLISKKNRYWGLALPIYECKKCNTFEVIGGKEELKKKAVSGWEKFEGNGPHRPWIDEVKISCRNCHEAITRIKDVGNPWLDAGIVPFSTITENNHGEPLYSKDQKRWREWFPADFITESFPGQFKNWFYALIAMSSALAGKAPFKTVLGFATLLAEDGRPMHKSWGNMIEFNEGAEKIGVDVMRWMYVRQNPASNLLFGYRVADEVRRKFHLILWNAYNFFVTYANLYQFKPDSQSDKPKNILDRWIISKLNNLILVVESSLTRYDAYTAALKIEEFISDLSTWFIRRSRARINDKVCLETLYEVLVTISKILAPFLPFISEEIFTNLTKEESVHLSTWPKVNKELTDLTLEKEMNEIRSMVEVFHSLRKQKKIKLRIPIVRATYKREARFSKELERVMAEELNIKQLLFEKSVVSNNSFWEVDLSEKNLDLDEGEAREIVRKVQRLRKEQKLALTDKITLTLPSWPKNYERFIKEKTLSVKIIQGSSLQIEKTPEES